MTESQWSHADQASSALQTYAMETRDGFLNDEGSEEFEEVLLSFLTDLKHLLWRVYGPSVALEDLVQQAVDRWSSEADELPEGGDDDD